MSVTYDTEFTINYKNQNLAETRGVSSSTMTVLTYLTANLKLKTKTKTLRENVLQDHYHSVS